MRSLSLCALLCAAVPAAALAAAPPKEASATYAVTLTATAAPKLAIHAVIPAGEALLIAESRPGDIPETADAGWPALIHDLKVTDAEGNPVTLGAPSASGWLLPPETKGPLTLDYTVDESSLAARGYPAPRESAFADADHVVLSGRGLFIVTSAQEASRVKFTAPKGWRALAPWEGSGAAFTVPTTDDLQENLIAFSREAPLELTAAGFRFKALLLGHWRPAKAEVERVMRGVTPALVAMIGAVERGDYLVVLLPQAEDGGESFRASFAFNFAQDPTRANAGLWGNTIAHEIFHYWNGNRLRGADYPSTQWFQEGFTEYAANLATVSSGITTPDEFRARLAVHLARYLRLTTPLDAPGTHKGQPLYSGGALVAFCWDTQLLEETEGQASLGDALAALWRDTGNGTRPYAWEDIRLALAATGGHAIANEWGPFYERYIHEGETLPFEAALARVGWRLVQDVDGIAHIELDPNASAEAAALGRKLTGKRGEAAR